MNSSITCKQAVDYISKKEENKLSPAQRFRLWKHLGACSLCRIFSSQNKVIIQAFKQNENIAASLTDTERGEIITAVLDEQKG